MVFAAESRPQAPDDTLARRAAFQLADVTGGGFLKHMVRIMAGTLVDIGRGRFSPGLIVELLQTPNRCLGGVTAPPQGLCLLRVNYPPTPFIP